MAIINGNTGNTLAGGQSRFQNFSTTSNRPDGLSQQIQQPYIQDGFTYKSNNKFVMQRDDAGNIIIDPQNKLLCFFKSECRSSFATINMSKLSQYLMQ